MVRTVRFTALALAGAAALPLPAFAEADLGGKCAGETCTYQVTAAQILEQADLLVSEHRFAEAAPFLAALENAPQYAMERQFLLGYSAIETGNLDSAITHFRAALVNHPEQTRVRLELARALMMKGNTGAADHHFRLAQNDDNLPPELAATVRSARSILRDKRDWSFNVNFGFAPDSNITNGTNAESVDVAFGNQTVPLTLSPDARRKSGTGQTLGWAGSTRVGISDGIKLLIDSDTQAVNYSGKAHDDITAQLAVGPEFRLSDDTQLSVQAMGTQRWYGGRRANTAGGMRATIQHALTDTQRIAFSLDARRTMSANISAYSGWQFGGYATYERVIGRSMIASASLYARRDSLNAAAYSGTELGFNLGVGGELPLGITAGVSGGLSKAGYDAPVALFGGNPRSDLRLSARVQLGLRSMRLLGFSPSVTYTYLGNDSNLALYKTSRHRLRFGFARYF